MNQMTEVFDTINTIIFVHPLMSVSFNFQLIHEYGCKIFSISTTIETNKIDCNFLKDNSDFYFAGSDMVENDYSYIKKIIDKENLNILAVVNGIDATLYYNDFLVNKLLGLNLSLIYSKIRMNKYCVHKVLVENKIPLIPSLVISNAFFNKNTIIEINEKLGYPLIIKPTENTASMAGFRVIASEKKLVSTVQELVGSKNDYYGGRIHELMVQKKISDDEYGEYAIDFLTLDGKHYLQGILIYDKESHDGEIICRAARPLVLDDIENIKPVIKYVEGILTALDVKYGFTHNEVFWDGKDSFYFIESNNRLAGSGILHAYKNCYGYSPMENLLKNVVYKSEMQYIPKMLQTNSLAFRLYNYADIVLTKLNLDDIRSFQEIIVFYPYNHGPIKDAYTRAEHTTAVILLSNTDKALLYDDISAIIEREHSCSLFIRS